MVILAACGWVIWEGNTPPSDEVLAQQEPRLSMAGEITAKMCVGLGQWSPDLREMILGQSESLANEGRLGAAAQVVLAAELNGLDEARKQLADARADNANESDAKTREVATNIFDVLARLYSVDPNANAGQTQPAALSEDDRAMLTDHLGWVGRLAPLVQPLGDGSAERDALLAPLQKMPLVMMVFMGWMGLCGLGGLAALITLLVLLLRERLRHGFRASCGSGPVYAEVFAVWTAIFVGGKIVVTHFEWEGLWISLVLTIGALVLALGWAIMRGIAWRDVRQDLGLHAGRGVVVEVLAGVTTYCMALPMLLVGLLLTLVLIAIQKVVTPNAAPPGHPIQEIVMGADWKVLVEAMVMAAIIAPFVEETVFRGALFRHLRDATWRLGTLLSFAVSAGLSSLLFAAIHPQGWPFIPVLASLAMAFCIAREWRGSLLPGMVAHGLNNFVILTLNILLLGSR